SLYMTRRPPTPTLFPYTTLFRSRIDKYDSRVRMTGAKREYSGAALNSFILALGHSHGIVQKILTHAGVDRIDPERWYEFGWAARSEEHTSELQSRENLVCRLLLE